MYRAYKAAYCRALKHHRRSKIGMAPPMGLPPPRSTDLAAGIEASYLHHWLVVAHACWLCDQMMSPATPASPPLAAPLAEVPALTASSPAVSADSAAEEKKADHPDGGLASPTVGAAEAASAAAAGSPVPALVSADSAALDIASPSSESSAQLWDCAC